MRKSVANLGPAIDMDSRVPLSDQLRDALAANSARVIDLFREWDDDGNGLVSKKEFRQAMQALGLGKVPRRLRPS